jgi:hypothetical protein
MKMKTILAFLAVVSLAAAAGAQTKVSGTLECAKPDPQHMVEVGDEAGHAFSIGQFKCTWSERLDYNGIKSKEGVGTSFDEISGTSSSFRGFYLDTMENGDNAHYRYEGTANVKGEMVETAESTWELFVGTGKMKGIKASGSCKGKGTEAGGVVWKCEGNYKPST